MPLGTAIHNIEITLGKGGQLARAAGAVATLIAKEDRFIYEFIAGQLKNRVSFRKAMKKAIELTEQANTKGIQVQIAGCIDGKEIARVEWTREATEIVGQVGNVGVNQKSLGRAGSKCWLGKRPVVRGVVMNPVDHPHGGGEGRAPIGRKRPATPWGYPALGRRSRKRNKYSENLILRRRSK
ncbi:hypothetical protein JRO89_XS06G0000700 [Xanthoceras sorbifolium]|uniref:Large ribosomal subunit protein uL2 C-terminal domain-containing protein n=1 Tax=Xanthoceras sorbifolium TaxID=99658 RepID=A0ABQ8HW08_9ROSI|nr:hypothetical protein JRO89_XS06G0000700 [Xanthoceras sorbifolium]